MKGSMMDAAKMQQEDMINGGFMTTHQRRHMSTMLTKSQTFTASGSGGASLLGDSGFDYYMPPGGISGGVDIRPSMADHIHHDAHSGKECTVVRFNPAGTLLASAGGDGVIKIWDAQSGGSGECVDTLRHFNGKPISALGFSGIGDLLMACSFDRQIKIYSLKYRKVNHQMSGGHSETINACVFCFSQSLALTGSGDRTIKVWDASLGQQKGKMSCASGIFSLDIALSDSVVASGHRDGGVRFWSIRDH